jgi:UV DNA damage repair endonuclease
VNWLLLKVRWKLSRKKKGKKRFEAEFSESVGNSILSEINMEKDQATKKAVNTMTMCTQANIAVILIAEYGIV